MGKQYYRLHMTSSGNRSKAVVAVMVYPLSLRKRISGEGWRGYRKRYTTRLGCALIIAVSVDSSLPLRGGSRITTSGRSPFLSISERYFLRCLRKNCVLNTVFHCIFFCVFDCTFNNFYTTTLFAF